MSVCCAPVCHPCPSPSPACARGDLRTTRRPSASGQVWPPYTSAQSVEPALPLRCQRALLRFTQWYRFESWKPQTEMTVQNKKWFRVITIDVFFLGRKCWLWVLSECAMRNSQRVPLTIWNFQRMFQPSKRATLLESVLAFIKTLCKLGKLIEGRKRSDEKAKTPAK